MPTPERPAYAKLLVEAAERAQSSGVARPRPVHMHFGWWDAPAPEQGDAARQGTHVDFERAQSRLTDALLDRIGLADGQVIVDVGCGMGGTLFELQQRVAGARLFGVDIGPEQLRVCRALCPPIRGNTVGWIAADAEAFGRLTPPADVVLAVECMFHFPSRARFVAAVADALPSGGVFGWTDVVAGAGFDALAPEVAAMVRGLGPWPDPACSGGTAAELSSGLGAQVEVHEDITARVLPGFAVMGEGRALADADDPRRVLADGVVALERLLRAGALRVELGVARFSSRS